MNVTVCDDERVQSDLLTRLLHDWASSRREIVRVTTFPSAETYLSARDAGFDDSEILLLDIQMPGIGGVELAKRVRESGGTQQIVFVTGYADYMAAGYDVDALHYLLKPVDRDKLYAVLDKAAAILADTSASLALTTDDGVVRVKTRDIMLVESFAHTLEITTTDAKYTVKTPISALEQQLGGGFVRCHRSYLAGLRHIAKITKTDVILDGGRTVPLSRRMYADVNRAFIRFCTGEMS